MTETKKETKGVVFHTNTIINPESWEMLGVSVKEGDNPIGQFGTGMSLAIAGLLRLNHKITIYSEGEIYQFTTRDMEFRGKDFKRIYCNETPLSFTTHFAFQWEPWMLYREFISNTIDEGGIWMSGTTPIEGGTSIVIEGEEIWSCLAKHEEYFLGEREHIATTRSVDIYEGRGVIYHKGVKVGEIQNASYSYHIKDYIELTEDRTFKYEYQIYQKIGEALTKQLTDKTLLERFICMQNGYEADSVDYDWSWSDEFKNVCKDLWATSPAKINKRIQSLIRKKMKDATFEFIEFSEDEVQMIDKAKDFLGRAGYPVSAPIKKVESDDGNVIAYECSGVIHLTQKAFDEGMFLLTVALFEEQQHVNGYLDMQRDYQTYLTKELIKQAKKVLKETF